MINNSRFKHVDVFIDTNATREQRSLFSALCAPREIKLL